MPTEVDRIYAAGLFDGEGTVGLSNYVRFRYPTVSLASTTKGLIDFMKDTFGGTICSKRKYKKKHSPSWHWHLDWQRAIVFLTEIVPYMKEPEKVRRANLLIHGYTAVTPRNGRYTPEQVIAKRDFERRFFRPGSSITA
jgi:hypothetical protein